jgi:outer membrane protein TolC
MDPHGRRRKGRTRALVAGLGLVVGLGTLLPASPAASAEKLSLTLDEAVEIALAENKTLAIADAQTEAAEARVGQARSAFLPALTASASYTRLDEAPYISAGGIGDMFEPLMVPFQDLVDNGYLDPSTLEGLGGTGSDKIYIGDDDIYTVGLHVRQPLFTGGAIIGGYQAAKHYSNAVDWSEVRTRDEVTYRVSEAYYTMIRAVAALDVMEDSVAQLEGYLTDLENLFEAGMLLEKDVMAVRVQLSNAKLGRNAAAHAIQLAMAGLAFEMGIDTATEIEALDPLEAAAFPDSDLEAWKSVALEERPDLKALGETVQVADRGVTIARSEYWPDLVFLGNYSWDRPNREYEQEFYGHWDLTVALEMNVFDWGRVVNSVRESKSQLTQAEEGYAIMEDAVRLDVQASYLEREQALEAVSIAEAGLEAAREGLRVTYETFQSGMALNREVLDAQAEFTRASLSRIQSVTNLRLAEARLELASGVIGE